LTANTGGIVISELEAQDIDTETDWKLAEIKHQLAK
jgi:N-acylneuraminate cytidylyltransferase